jgi:sugar phosphate isomerase/epimerase
MKYAICNETFGDWPVEKGLELARRCGYTGIEVAPFTLGNSAGEISAQQRKDYVSKANDFGLEIVGLHWLLAKTSGYHLTMDDAALRSKTRDYFIALSELCRDLGGKIMVLGSPLQRNFPATMSHQEAIANAALLLKQVVPALESCNVRIAVEPLGPQEGNFLNHAAQARELIDMIDSDHVRLHLDVKAMSTEEEPIEEIIQRNSDILIHFHANDPNRLGPGMGSVDQRPIFEMLHQIQYDGWISVEVFDYSLGPERLLRESMANMLAAQAKPSNPSLS